MKKFLLLAFLFGLTSPLFAGESTSGYKKQESCLLENPDLKYIFAKKEGSSSKKWGTYKCVNVTSSKCWDNYVGEWISKGVSYDEAHEDYETGCDS